MTHENRYFIEYRICGKLRLAIIELREILSRNFPEIEQFGGGPVLHITLIPPINKNIPKEYFLELIQEELKRLTSLLEFEVEGYDFFDNLEKKPLFIKIKFDKLAEKFIENITKKLDKRIGLENKYENEGFNPHISLGFVKNKKDAKRIIEFLNNNYPLNLKQVFDRITILNGSKIQWEYSILEKTVLNRNEALNHRRRLDSIRDAIRQKGVNEKELLTNEKRGSKLLESLTQGLAKEDTKKSSIKVRKTLWKEIRSLFKGG